MIFGIYRVSGHSMMPILKPHDRVIVTSIPYYFSKPKVSDIVVFAKDGKMLIKRIVKVSKNGFYVKGDNRSDSLRVDPIKQDRIVGKVLWALF